MASVSPAPAARQSRMASQCHLGASLAGIQWVTNGYLLALAVALITMGRIGLSRIGLSSSLNDTIGWFALLGLGLSPVMVGATDVIVGNAPVRLAGVAGGLQSTAMQVGGTIGTAVLGAIMSARVDTLLPTRWAAAHLPVLSGSSLAEVKSAATVGVAPDASARVGAVVHGTFVSGMNAAFGVAAAVSRRRWRWPGRCWPCWPCWSGAGVPPKARLLRSSRVAGRLPGRGAARRPGPSRLCGRAWPRKASGADSMIAKPLTPFFGAKVFAIIRKVPADAAATLAVESQRTCAPKAPHALAFLPHFHDREDFSVSLD